MLLFAVRAIKIGDGSRASTRVERGEKARLERNFI